MTAIATLGDAPTAAIAVVAILLGLLFAARGSRDRRAPAGGEETPAGPSLLTSVPVAVPPEPEAEPGFVGPEGTIVGHGPIRLGSTHLHDGAAEPEPATPIWAPAAPQAPAEAPAPAPVVDAEPAAPAEPAPPGEAAESAFPGQPEAAPTAAQPEPALPAQPAWQRHMPHPTNPFRQGTIKLGGKPAGKPPTD